MTAQKHAHLKQMLMGVRNPTDLTTGLVEAFNVKYRSNVATSDLVPEVLDGLTEEAALNTVIKDEFSLENDPCFRKVCRLQPEKGQTLPRLTQAYLFYKHLEDMSRYWDNSKDNYFTKEVDTAPSQSDNENKQPPPHKENIPPITDQNSDIHMANSANHIMDENISTVMQNLYTGRRRGNASTMPPPLRDGTLEGILRVATQKFDAVCKPPSQQYTRLQVGCLLIPVRQTHVVGRVPSDRADARKGKTCGPLMLGSARAEVVFRGEGEQVGHGQAEVADLLRELGGLLLLAQQRNREGIKEAKPGDGEHCWWARKARWGGGIGGKMPHEVEAENEKEMAGESSKIDGKDIVMRDVSNGHKSTKRSADTSLADDDPNLPLSSADVQRPARAMVNTIRTASLHQDSNAPDKAASSSSPLTPTIDSAAAVPSSTRPMRPPMSSRRAKLFAEAWKHLRPPSSLWDPSIKYQAIGRPDHYGDGEWDNIFMLSSVNTHVCLVKMTVSKSYLKWLESGTSVEGTGNTEGGVKEQPKEKKLGRSGISLPVKEEKDWEGMLVRPDVLYVERSCWWNLFVPEERVEALRGLWTVLSWLNRDRGGGKVFGSVE